ncbi:hypothetical protein [Actinoplanes aureus]|jgi:hypothetical protein|uniref:Uncharacterized protein n=1 Tax=Actinoplanes aureus TaxID=2792083 RepID=A0A931CHB6_9ACTN|nr:hypothetical protein [Actinoplanes aureus]MBG0568624.1 hypothetical protein [Actinoplanes aureus]
MKLSRLLAAPVFAGAMLLTQIAGIGPAQAAPSDPHCNYDFRTFNACLRFFGTGQLNEWRAVAGQDAFMSQRSAQEKIDHGTNFRAQLFGDDGNRRTLLADLFLAPGWPAAGPGGLSAELTRVLHGSTLNEDTDGNDEIYAEITYWDFVINDNVTHRTGTVVHEFAPRSEVPDDPGCRVICP